MLFYFILVYYYFILSWFFLFTLVYSIFFNYFIFYFIFYFLFFIFIFYFTLCLILFFIVLSLSYFTLFIFLSCFFLLHSMLSFALFYFIYFMLSSHFLLSSWANSHSCSLKQNLILLCWFSDIQISSRSAWFECTAFTPHLLNTFQRNHRNPLFKARASFCLFHIEIRAELLCIWKFLSQHSSFQGCLKICTKISPLLKISLELLKAEEFH